MELNKHTNKITCYPLLRGERTDTPSVPEKKKIRKKVSFGGGIFFGTEEYCGEPVVSKASEGRPV